MSTLTRAEIAAYALCAVVVALLGMRALRSAPAPAPAAVAERPATSGSGPRVEQDGGRAAVVHVVGAVRRPGVYTVAAGGRVRDAVRRAGGATGAADLSGLNLAAKAVDGQQVVVPRRGAAAAPAAVPEPGGGGAAATAATPVNLNTATQAELETLDGVGPALAARILAFRQERGGFRAVDDLAQVPGIGPKRLAAFKARVRL